MRHASKNETHYGVVTNVGDPDKRGRIKAKVQGVAAADAELPYWIEPEDPSFTSSGGGGSLWLPKVGTTVEVVFAVHDETDQIKNTRFLQGPAPKWRQGAPTKSGGPQPVPDDFKSGYPEVRGWVTPAGHKILLDDNGSVTFVHKSGAQIEMDKQGAVIVSAASGAKITLNDGADAPDAAMRGTTYRLQQATLDTSLQTLFTTLAANLAAASLDPILIALCSIAATNLAAAAVTVASITTAFAAFEAAATTYLSQVVELK